MHADLSGKIFSDPKMTKQISSGPEQTIHNAAYIACYKSSSSKKIKNDYGYWYWSICDTVPVPRVADPDPNWIPIQSGQWIRNRIWNPDPNPGGQK